MASQRATAMASSSSLYEGLRTRQPANVSSSSLITPTALERTGDFRNTPAASRPNVSCLGIQYKLCPSFLDPVAQNALKFVPLGDSTPGPNYGHPEEQAANGNINVDQGMARVDSRVGRDHQLSAMYFESRGTTSAVFLSGAKIFGLPPDARNVPVVQQFSAGIQQQYSAKWGSEISYVGNLGRHFYIAFDENSPVYNANCTSATCGSTIGQNSRRTYQPTPATYTFSSISLYAPVTNSSYHSLQATLTRRFDQRLSIQASFVWSKVIGYGPLTNAYDLGSSRGVLDIDVPYSFVMSYIFVSPRIDRWEFVGKQLLSGWQINGVTYIRAGQPFNVTSGVDTNFDGTINDRPNVVGNPYLSRSRDRTAKRNAYFNTAAFAIPPAGSPYGNTPFNMFYGPGYVDTDLSVSKAFHIDRLEAQFRGEVFNIFNNVNMSSPNSNMSSPGFGAIPAAGAPRIAQLALRISF